MDMDLNPEQLKALFDEIQARDLRELKKLNEALSDLLLKSRAQLAEEKRAVDTSAKWFEEKKQNERNGRVPEEGSDSQP